MAENDSSYLLTYPIISAAAICLGKSQAAAARLYDIIQTLARARNGYPFFTRDELIVLGFLDEQQVDRALRAGLDLFWYRTANGEYHMISRAKVAAALGLQGKPGRAVLLPAEAYTGRLSNYKAWVYAGYLAQLYKQTPSREDLLRVFGVTLPTLLDWERKTGVKPRPRHVMLKEDLIGATGEQRQVATLYDELNQHSGPRKWITIVGPRGGVYARRRLMDNENSELDDYWQITEEPAWEIGGLPVVTWQTTNDYSNTPVRVAPRGRGSWLHSDIKGLGSPDVMGTGDKPNSSPVNNQNRPGWHDDIYTAIKWQNRRWNRSKPAIVARYTIAMITGVWLPSHAALWGEAI